MKAFWKQLFNGIIKENPTFVLMLGMCPTLAVTTAASNGLGMGLTTTAVLMLSNAVIASLRKIIPDRVRIPAYIVIVATMVTVVQQLLQAYMRGLYETLGIYIPLIVVNCIILGRSEAFAAKNTVLASFGDGIGIGLGFTIGLTLIGIFREVIGNGTFFDIRVLPESYEPVSIFVMAPGAFFVLAMLVASQNKIKRWYAAKKDRAAVAVSGCTGECAGCGVTRCGKVQDEGGDGQ